MEIPDIISRYKITKKSWNKRRESTCTNGQHVGHYQATFRHKNLGWLMFQRGDIPAITGYSPKRHRTCVDLQILKKAQTFELKTQRTLCILDTEFNNINGHTGCQIIHNSMKLGVGAEEQFAGKNRSALQEIIAKRCAIDHQQSQQMRFSLTSCDLAGCYDRIIHTAAALAMLNVGISHSRVKTMFNSIQKNDT